MKYGLITIALMAGSAFGATVDYNLSTGSVSATLSFNMAEQHQLQVTLSSEISGAASSQDLLRAVFFTVPPDTYLHPEYTLSSVQVQCSTCVHPVFQLAQIWAFANGVDPMGNGHTYSALGFAELSYFGFEHRLADPTNPQYLTTGMSDALQGTYYQQVVVTFNPSPYIDLNAMGPVGFLVGSQFYWVNNSEPLIDGPEPATLLLTGLGLAAAGLIRRRIRKPG